MSRMDSARLDELLDWLAEAVAARLHAGEGPTAAGDAGRAEPELAMAGAVPSSPGEDEAPAPVVAAEVEAEELQSEDAVPSGVVLPSHAAQLLGRLAIGLVAVVVLINIPLGLRGRAIARMIPSSVSLVVRDGLLVRETGTPDVYVYQGGAFHWITGLDVFERYGYRWQNVHEVAPGFLAGYELGRPLYLLAKCPDSPHIYRLENGSKRWIVDMAAFEAEGFQWSDVQMMSCYTLRDMPDGETIPPGHGPAPAP